MNISYLETKLSAICWKAERGRVKDFHFANWNEQKYGFTRRRLRFWNAPKESVGWLAESCAQESACQFGVCMEIRSVRMCNTSKDCIVCYEIKRCSLTTNFLMDFNSLGFFCFIFISFVENFLYFSHLFDFLMSTTLTWRLVMSAQHQQCHWRWVAWLHSLLISPKKNVLVFCIAIAGRKNPKQTLVKSCLFIASKNKDPPTKFSFLFIPSGSRKEAECLHIRTWRWHLAVRLVQVQFALGHSGGATYTGSKPFNNVVNFSSLRDWYASLKIQLVKLVSSQWFDDLGPKKKTKAWGLTLTWVTACLV